MGSSSPGRRSEHRSPLTGVAALLAALLTVVHGAAGCATGDGGDRDRAGGGSAAVPAVPVELPAGSSPVVLSPAGDALLVGVRREGRPLVPGLLRREPDGTVTELAVNGATPYGRLATWQSVASDGRRVLAAGGERGGAHGNVRWSVWTGTTGEVTEWPQGFSTFGGWGAGDVIDVVLTPAGDLLIGTWQSAEVGFDVAVWTAAGNDWTRQSSAATALENQPDTLTFPMSATGFERGAVVAGWRLVLDGSSRQEPVVWRSDEGNSGWTSETLPDAGQLAAGMAVRCWTSGCGIAGRVDGTLALWRLDARGWTSVPDAPPVAVGDRDILTAPIEVDGRLVQLVTDGGRVRIAQFDGTDWTAADLAGPTGTVTETTRVGDAIYLVAGPDADTRQLWRIDLAALAGR